MALPIGRLRQKPLIDIYANPPDNVYVSQDSVTMVWPGVSRFPTLARQPFRIIVSVSCVGDCKPPSEYDGPKTGKTFSFLMERKVRKRWKPASSATYYETKEGEYIDCDEDTNCPVLVVPYSFVNDLLNRTPAIPFSSQIYIEGEEFVSEFLSNLTSPCGKTKCEVGDDGGWYASYGFTISGIDVTEKDYLIPLVTCQPNEDESVPARAAAVLKFAEVLSSKYGFDLSLVTTFLIAAELLQQTYIEVGDVRIGYDLFPCECPPKTRCVPLVGCQKEEEDPVAVPVFPIVTVLQPSVSVGLFQYDVPEPLLDVGTPVTVLTRQPVIVDTDQGPRVTFPSDELVPVPAKAYTTPTSPISKLRLQPQGIALGGYIVGWNYGILQISPSPNNLVSGVIAKRTLPPYNEQGQSGTEAEYPPIVLSRLVNTSIAEGMSLAIELEQQRWVSAGTPSQLQGIFYGEAYPSYLSEEDMATQLENNPLYDALSIEGGVQLVDGYRKAILPGQVPESTSSLNGLIDEVGAFLDTAFDRLLSTGIGSTFVKYPNGSSNVYIPLAVASSDNNINSSGTLTGITDEINQAYTKSEVSPIPEPPPPPGEEQLPASDPRSPSHENWKKLQEELKVMEKNRKKRVDQKVRQGLSEAQAYLNSTSPEQYQTSNDEGGINPINALTSTLSVLLGVASFLSGNGFRDASY